MSQSSSPLAVLTYHALHASLRTAKDFYSVGIDQFERQICFLSQQGYRTLLIDELAESHGAIDRRVCLTFDDGNKSDVDFAVPLLQRYGFRGTFFVVVELIDRPGYMSWADLRQVLASGSSIQCHGLRHVDLTQLRGEDLLCDLRVARSSLEEKLGIAIRALAFPFGRWNTEVIEIAQTAGFQTVLTSEQKLAFPGASRLPRLVVHSGTTDERFQRIVRRERRLLLSSWLCQSSIEAVKSTLGRERYARLKQKLLEPISICGPAGKSG